MATLQSSLDNVFVQVADFQILQVSYAAACVEISISQCERIPLPQAMNLITEGSRYRNFKVYSADQNTTNYLPTSFYTIEMIDSVWASALGAKNAKLELEKWQLNNRFQRERTLSAPL